MGGLCVNDPPPSPTGKFLEQMVAFVCWAGGGSLHFSPPDCHTFPWWAAANSQWPAKWSSQKLPELLSRTSRARQRWTSMLRYARDGEKVVLVGETKPALSSESPGEGEEKFLPSLCLLSSSSPVVLISSSRWVENGSLKGEQVHVRLFYAVVWPLFLSLPLSLGLCSSLLSHVHNTHINNRRCYKLYNCQLPLNMAKTLFFISWSFHKAQFDSFSLNMPPSHIQKVSLNQQNARLGHPTTDTHISLTAQTNCCPSFPLSTLNPIQPFFFFNCQSQVCLTEQICSSQSIRLSTSVV